MTGPLPRNPLEILGEKYQPSKRWHDYLKHYWRHFSEMRYAVKTFLEIGVSDGVGLKMWEEFFPNAQIYGIDINPASMAVDGGRIHVKIGDQGDVNFLSSVMNWIGKELDIVIDDGSHIRAHQILGFEQIFPAVRDGGIYVLEDLAVDSVPERLEVVHRLKKLLDHLNYWPPGHPASDWPYLTAFPESASWLDKHIVGVAFYRYIAFVMKGKNPEDNQYLQYFPKGG